ncbi:MAG TPA: hypothetical protein VK203_26385 [Nostocaceae cyanobacterium]|nr:hypothetical protein [Nostocaceae cyanobacterium]
MFVEWAERLTASAMKAVEMAIALYIFCYTSYCTMRVVKFTHYSLIIHQILSYSHFSLPRLNFYPKVDGTG